MAFLSLIIDKNYNHCKFIQAYKFLDCLKVNLLSKQFVEWDVLLTQIEQAMEVKPAD